MSHRQNFHFGQERKISPAERERKKRTLRGFLRFILIWSIVYTVTGCIMVAGNAGLAIRFHLIALGSWWIYLFVRNQWRSLNATERKPS